MVETLHWTSPGDNFVTHIVVSIDLSKRVCVPREEQNFNFYRFEDWTLLFMRSILDILQHLQRAFFIALPLSITLLFLFPTPGHAQAILLRSDPIQNAILNSAPTRVRMWFSDDLSSTSTAMVTLSNRRIDLHNAHISPTDSHEMDVGLQPISGTRNV